MIFYCKKKKHFLNFSTNFHFFPMPKKFFSQTYLTHCKMSALSSVISELRRFSSKVGFRRGLWTSLNLGRGSDFRFCCCCCCWRPVGLISGFFWILLCETSSQTFSEPALSPGRVLGSTLTMGTSEGASSLSSSSAAAAGFEHFSIASVVEGWRFWKTLTLEIGTSIGSSASECARMLWSLTA